MRLDSGVNPGRIRRPDICPCCDVHMIDPGVPSLEPPEKPSAAQANILGHSIPPHVQIGHDSFKNCNGPLLATACSNPRLVQHSIVDQPINQHVASPPSLHHLRSTIHPPLARGELPSAQCSDLMLDGAVFLGPIAPGARSRCCLFGDQMQYQISTRLTQSGTCSYRRCI